MSLQIADNFSYKGKKPLDARLVCNDIPDMLALPTSTIYDGIIVYVVAQKKFYTYDSNNTVDPTLQQWRELTTAGILIQSATIDNVTTSATKGHLILTMSDGTTIDCGNAKGDKGDKGDGFAIIKLYTSVSDMTSDSNPVNDGQMVAIIDTTTNPITAKVYIRNSTQTQDASGNENGYTFFCNLADATVIQGPQGPQGQKGDKGDTPVITTQAIAATSTMPSGTKITFTTGTGSTATSTSINVYNGKDGISVQSATINASGELVFTLSDASTINVGKIGGNGTGGCITMLGCFDTAPTTFAQNDIYYNNLDGLIYKSPDGTTWGTGSQPEKDILYISMDDHKIYSYTNNTFEVYGGGGGSGSNNGFYKTTDSITATIDATTTLDITNISELSISDVIIGETIVYDNQGTNAVVTAKDTTNNTIDVKTISTGGTINYNVDRSGQELKSAYAKLNSSWTISVNSNVPLVLKSGNIIQPSTGLFTIPDGTRVEIIFSTSSNPVGDTSYSLYNNTDSAYISDITNIDPYKGDNYLNSTVLSAQWTNNTGHSVDISIRASKSSATSTLIGHTSLTIKEIGRIVDPIQYTANNDELEETPVGNIISYMGNDTPKHYLDCDGTEYNVGDYPELEAHIIKEFGSINYFGGDGTTTWAVPDLNGEFLRGTGTNSHANQGNGENVGKHQDSTKYSYIQFSNAGIWGSTGISGNHDFEGNITTGRFFGTTTHGDNQISYFTSRPTNTSVKFCIKYESTYHVIVPSHMYKVNIPFSTVSSSSSVYATFDSTNIIGDTSLVDTTNNQFIAPMHGWYSVSFNTSQGSSRKCPATYLEKYEGGTKIEEIAMANGFNTGEDYYSGTISTTVYLKKNQTIKYRVHNTGALSGEASFCLLTANYKDNIIAGGEVYSTEEQLIGTWTDGKPLYQKTIHSILPSSIGNDKFEDIGATIDTIVDIKAQALRDNNYSYAVNGVCVMGDFSSAVMIDATNNNAPSNKNKVGFVVNKTPFVSRPIVVTVQYTKTTDTAGTYQYKNSLLLTRPDMWEPNTEYDFGGGLYGRRFSGTISQSANTLSMLSLGSIGIRQIINCGGNWYHGTEYVSLNGTNEGHQSSGLIMSNNSLSLRTFSDQTRTNAPYDIWVTYKK